ncbi:MAG TPA: PHP domain-containing protein, partial [Pyrinomonadaceae bacterium]
DPTLPRNGTDLIAYQINMPKPKLDKFAIASTLQKIAALMEIKGGKYRFKAKAYNAGARVIQSLANLDQLVAQDRLTSLPKIGEALASQVKELYLTGESSVLKELNQEFPEGTAELSTVPGLSPVKVKQLQTELGIKSIAELRTAAKEGRIRELKGFGAKTEQQLLKSLDAEKTTAKKRLHINHAWNTGERMLEFVSSLDGVIELSLTGSLRRREETIDRVEVIASSKKPAELLKLFAQFPMIISSEIKENTCFAQLVDGAPVSLTAVEPEDFAVMLFATTGSEKHVAKITRYAAEKDISFAILDGKRKRAPINEDEIYGRVKMQFVPPELREDEGEIEAALAKKLPDDLLEFSDIKGMVHCHTTYSDGSHSLEQMVTAAQELGMKYITITDHSPTAFYANGVNVDRLQRQWDEIDELQARVKIKILRGTESDIVASGELDYPDRILEKFDVIVASVHARYKMDKAKMTERLVTAMRNPVYKIWGHALGRLLQRRPAFDCDVERVLDVIAESRAAIEINGSPYRLDLEPRLVREARKRKINFVISVDAHSMAELDYLKYGVAMARRGWLPKSEVLNTMTAAAFAKAVKP